MRATGPLTARDVELSVAGATKALTAELAALRADLADARADVARFEAALDAANRELAIRTSSWEESLDRCGALLDDKQRLTAELDSARRTIAELRGQCAAMMRESGQQAGE